MSEVDISEELPNTDDSAFAEDQQQNGEGGNDNHAGTTTISAPHGAIAADHVFVATSQGLLTAEQLQEAAGIKTTHIVIHDQTLNVDSSPTELKTPTTPLPPPTPATPQSKERGFRYQWDSSVHSEVLPVRCKNTNGELHKAKFGSGISTLIPCLTTIGHRFKFVSDNQLHDNLMYMLYTERCPSSTFDVKICCTCHCSNLPCFHK